MNGLAATPFKLSAEEVLLSAASTLCLNQLARVGVQERTLDELCSHPQYGFTASANKEPIGPRFVRITDIREGRIDWESVPFCDCEDPRGYELMSGDILVARSGSVGKSFMVTNVPEIAVFASYMIRLRAEEGTMPSYLYWCLQSQQFWQQIMGARRGSAMKNINGKMLAALRFPHPSISIQEGIVAFLESFRDRLHGGDKPLADLPPPLSEQRRILARIEALAAHVQDARALRHQLAEEAEAFAGSVATRLFQSFPEHEPIEAIAEVRGGIQKSPHRVPGVNPVRYLTVAHVHRNQIATDDPRYFEVTSEELERWRLIPGDVLIIEGNGSAQQIGRTALFRGEIENCVHQNHVIRMRPYQHRVLPELLNSFLNSPVGQDAVQAQSRTSSGLRTLSVGRIKAIRVPVPSLSRQRRIVAELDALQAQVEVLKRLQAETAAELDALLPSILDKAFKGEL